MLQHSMNNLIFALQCVKAQVILSYKSILRQSTLREGHHTPNQILKTNSIEDFIEKAAVIKTDCLQTG